MSMRHHCCNKQKVKRGLWSPEEDEKLIKYVTAYGHGCWSSVPKQAGLQRCGKSCRLRWINYLRPDLKRGSFSMQEELVIIEAHRVLGNRWAKIAKHLPGRTDNEVKNFWNSYIKKKLIAQGIDPKTHEPLLPLENQSQELNQLNVDITKTPVKVLSKIFIPASNENPCLPSYTFPATTLAERFSSLNQDSMLPEGINPLQQGCDNLNTLWQSDLSFQMPSFSGNADLSDIDAEVEKRFVHGGICSSYDVKTHISFNPVQSSHTGQLEPVKAILNDQISNHGSNKAAESDHATLLRFCDNLFDPTKSNQLPKLYDMDLDECNSQPLPYLQGAHNNPLISPSSSSAYNSHHLDADLLDSSVPIGIYFANMNSVTTPWES